MVADVDPGYAEFVEHHELQLKNIGLPGEEGNVTKKEHCIHKTLDSSIFSPINLPNRAF